MARAFKRLSRAAECLLAESWRRYGDTAALQELIEAHRGLAIRLAQPYDREGNPPIEDLIQEGCVGLIVAARRFDPDSKARLSTYASYWINAYILEHIVRNRGSIRIGGSRSQRTIFFKLSRAEARIEDRREPVTREAIAKEIGVPLRDVDEVLPLLRGGVSLDAPRSADDDRSHEPADTRASQESALGLAEVKDVERERLQNALAQLDERERLIIEHHYLQEEPENMSAIGRLLGLSRERVRQLEVRALEKLREDFRPAVPRAHLGDAA